MLCRLRIRDFVLVENLTLAFDAGLTVLTGETGAGKSLLLDALSLLLGDRAEASMVRQGCDRAELEAEFEVSAIAGITAWLTEHDLAGDDLLILRRIIDAQGKSRAYIQGRAVTLGQLKELGELLVDLHGQHAHQSLLKPDEQRDLLDAYAGAQALGQAVRLAYRTWQQQQQALALAQTEQSQQQQRLEAVQERWQEFEPIAPKAGEYAELETLHQRLSNAATLIAGSQKLVYALHEGDDNLLAQMASLGQELDQLHAMDPGLQESAQLFQEACVQAEEAARALKRYLKSADLDEERLAEVDQRLSSIYRLARKWRMPPEELPAEGQRLQNELAALSSAVDMEALQAQCQAAEAHYQQLAQQLSQMRTQAAAQLSNAILTGLKQLSMVDTCFAVELQPGPARATGLEEVQWLMAPHHSLPLRPLQKVASGGELSRISLAIQVAISKVAHVPTLVFDEVDVGIGGKVAETVGRLLQQLGLRHQVLCITHLPQVAAHGDQHLQVQKQRSEQSVTSHIAVLTPEERVLEIARMLGGETLTEATRQHAQEMLSHAQTLAG